MEEVDLIKERESCEFIGSVAIVSPPHAAVTGWLVG